MDWNLRYEQGDIPWEKGRAAPPLAEYLETHTLSGRVLVPGCGYGHDVRLLAAQGAEPIGLDCAPLALHRALSYPATGLESYQLGDFINLDDALAGSFDWVFEHTCLCAIDPTQRRDYVKSAHRALTTNGSLLAIFYVTTENPDGPPFAIFQDEIDDLFHHYFETLEQWIPNHAYPGREGHEQMRRLRKK